MKEVYILSGAVHSGKTTALLKWAAHTKGVYGIAAPVINGIRYLQNLNNSEKHQLETDHDSDDNIAIGNYLFSEEIFKWGRDVLLDSLDKNPEWLVIDEIGLLELSGRGLEPAVTKALKTERKIKIILVIRQELVAEVIKYYGLDRQLIKEFRV
ncbi:MAG: hypothetical protein JXR46_01450 [Calditrichaceae bacterium]|nr:hypothetical protein [Calditrichaceae bacterium]MBN2707683.1 hypothetical protein [Calditrichaceae bacterium]RQV97785.1 MAG: hypothetical protein EH224_00185 [Calditrichota bacterium]